MSFKNALKNLVAHFGTVWALLLYIVIFAAVITGISLPFVLPVAGAFDKAGVFDHIGTAFSSLFGASGFNGFTGELYAAYCAVVEVFRSDNWIAALTTAFVIIVVVLLFRFFLGLYEIPMATVIDGRMSCNARYGLGGKFFSTLPRSMLYSLMKMLYTILFDAAIGALIYGLGKAMGLSLAYIFVVAFIIIILGSLRYSIVACWAPCVASGECGIFKGFVRSARLCFKNMGAVYSTYLISVVLVFALGAFITVFTLGVGLIIIMPICATFICYLNATVYYNKTGRRYYVDGIVFTPPAIDYKPLPDDM